MVRCLGDQEHLARRVLCPRCLSLLEYEPRDVQFQVDRTGSRPVVTYWVECVCCTNRVPITLNESVPCDA